MCNSTKPESYVDIEVVKQLNLLYQAKGKVSNVGYILYQARKSEGNMNMDELKQLSYKKNNKNIKL